MLFKSTERGPASAPARGRTGARVSVFARWLNRRKVGDGPRLGWLRPEVHKNGSFARLATAK